jgi:hypothetical protein
MIFLVAVTAMQSFGTNATSVIIKAANAIGGAV